MQHPRNSSARRGFTLVELLVSMAITIVIISVLVSVTAIALDTWNRSRSELRASRQAKAMIETMGRDFESMVVRKGSKSEWLSAITSPKKIGDSLESTNACDLLFFTAANDRYDGKIGTSGDKGGDISCVNYQLDYRDPISTGSTGFETYVLNRLLVNPDDTFKTLLGKTDLAAAFSSFAPGVSNRENFVCENVYQFSITFHVKVAVPATASGPETVANVPVTIGKSNGAQTTQSFKINGISIESEVADGWVTREQLATGRITAVGISMTVISDFGIDQIKRRTFNPTQQAEFLAKNSFQYSKLIQVSGM